jgi:predicted XRE-type DNA-binding protein
MPDSMKLRLALMMALNDHIARQRLSHPQAGCAVVAQRLS